MIGRCLGYFMNRSLQERERRLWAIVLALVLAKMIVWALT